MTRADDILQALLARRPAPILERRTGLPYGWAIWLRSLRPLQPAFGGRDVARAMDGHPLAGRVREPRHALGFWQALRRLWWQGWDPAPADQRGLRWLAAFVSFLLHVLLLVALLWIAHVRWRVPASAAGESGRVQLQFVGRGTPDGPGGGAGQPSAGAPTPTAAAAAAQPRPTQAAAAVASPPAPSAEAAEAAESAAPASPPAASKPEQATAPQPLQVTEAPVPTSDFVLPPPPTLRPPTVVPQPAVPQLQVIEREVRPVSDAPLPQPRMQMQPREIDVPVPSPEVREREIAVAPQVQVQIQQPRLRQREPEPVLRMPEIGVRQAEVSIPEPQAPATTAATASPAPAAVAVAVAPASVSPGQEQAQPPRSPGTAAATATNPAPAGPRAVDRSGGWDSVARGDDWGASSRNQQGTASAPGRDGEGLFNRDGSARLPGQGSGGQAQERGAPGGGSDTWTRERIAESGTWLKRPPYDYAPTSLDKYWVPNESLLEEWVRKGIKKIEIPIPGTSTRISCVVSLLQFGGGCGLANPNMNEQPAQARPPPDIPFKKELQEDNGSVR